MKNKKQKSAHTIVLYHKNCDDGFGAAWAAWKKFGSRAEYIGVAPGDSAPDGLEGKNVFTLDFCFPEKITTHLLKVTKSLVVIDHHVSSQKVALMVPQHVFDGEHTRSGATLSWGYFHPDRPVPKLLQYVEDVDLWSIKKPHTFELSAVLDVYPRDFKIWNKIAKDWEGRNIKQYIEKGKALVAYQKEVIEKVVEDAIRVKFCGITTYAANFSGKLVSSIGHALYTKLPPMAIIWSTKKDHIKVSLRSNGKVDVSKLAGRFGGGGGHKESSAFRLPLGAELPWKIVKK